MIDRSKLSKVLARLEGSTDAEILTAAKTAARMVSEANETWERLLSTRDTVAPEAGGTRRRGPGPLEPRGYPGYPPRSQGGMTNQEVSDFIQESMQNAARAFGEGLVGRRRRRGR